MPPESASLVLQERPAAGVVLLRLNRSAVRNALSLALCRAIAVRTPLAARQIKELILGSMNTTLEAGLRLERKTFQLLFSTAEKSAKIHGLLAARTKARNARHRPSSPLEREQLP
jgi:enoyl-CoA hydratase/carnithine racemase